LVCIRSKFAATGYNRSRWFRETLAAPKTSGAFARLLGVELVREDETGVELALDAVADHERDGGILHGGVRSDSEAVDRPTGTIHGGVMMSLLDMAMAGSVARTLAPGESTASVSITTDFLRAATRGRLTARGVLVRRGRTMAFPVGEIIDADGRLIARATGVWAIRAPAEDRA